MARTFPKSNSEAIKPNILKDKHEIMEWISVKDRLPEFGVTVLWYGVIKWMPEDKRVNIFSDSLTNHYEPVDYGGGGYLLDNQNDYLAYDGDYCDEVATHWMPLPEPPK